MYLTASVEGGGTSYLPAELPRSGGRE
jgi:hypothetical protein